MKSHGLVIDGSLQQSAPLLSYPSLQQSSSFPIKSVPSTSTQSFSSVIEQAVLTQDRSLLKQILLQSDLKLISNSVIELSPAKIAGFLSLLQEFLYTDFKNTRHYSLWLRELMTKHLGIIVSNSNNKEVMGRIRRWMAKKMEERANLMELRDRLGSNASGQKAKEFVVRFSYNESKQEVGMQEQLMMEEMLEDEDELLAQLDD